jgi:hypothetical protein
MTLYNKMIPSVCKRQRPTSSQSNPIRRYLPVDELSLTARRLKCHRIKSTIKTRAFGSVSAKHILVVDIPDSVLRTTRAS